MKFKLLFLSLCILLSIDSIKATESFAEDEYISLSATNPPFECPEGKGNSDDLRSIPMSIPFSAFLSDNHSIQLDFYQSIIGDVDIVISQNGMVVYTSTENISSPVLKEIQLSQDLSGEFLLEIKGSNGAYAFGMFNLN